jgi:hypothetical protein
VLLVLGASNTSGSTTSGSNTSGSNTGTTALDLLLPTVPYLEATFFSDPVHRVGTLWHIKRTACTRLGECVGACVFLTSNLAFYLLNKINDSAWDSRSGEPRHSHGSRVV